MNSADVRDRDTFLKRLRRRLPDPDAPVKKSTPELMVELTSSFVEEYDAGKDARRDQARTVFDNQRKDG